MFTIRRAVLSDAPAMGRVHVRAWQAAYRGQMPDAYLDGLSATERARLWSGILAKEDEARPILVAEEDGELAGFASVGPASGSLDEGELYSINVDPGHWGHGCGRKLLAAAEDELAVRGYQRAALWVLPGNERARRFYRLAGWTEDGTERTAEVLGVEVAEVRYRRALEPPGHSIH